MFHNGKPAVRVYKVGTKMERHLGGLVDEGLDLSFQGLSETAAAVIRLMPTQETFVRFHTEPNPGWDALMDGKDAKGRAMARLRNPRLAPYTVSCTAAARARAAAAVAMVTAGCWKRWWLHEQWPRTVAIERGGSEASHGSAERRGSSCRRAGRLWVGRDGG